jgi:hypothetical protein
MKLLVLILALVASAKLVYQEHLYRASTGAAIVAAYQVDAVQACRRAARSSDLGAALAKPQSVAFQVGNRDLDVFIWQIDSADWRARFTAPYVLITPRGRSDLHCAYDVRRRSARFQKS